MKRVIINADDLGISKGTNQAILKAFQEGVLSSASVMPNMPAFDDAVTNVISKNPSLGIGLHLSLTVGKPVLNKSEVPLLVDETGYFNNSFVHLWYLAIKNKNALKQIKNEITAQFDRIHTKKIKINHINSQHHIHMIPHIFDIVLELAMKYGCHKIRFSEETLAIKLIDFSRAYYSSALLTDNLIKKIVLHRLAKTNRDKLTDIQTTDYFYGILNSSFMDCRVLKYILKTVQNGCSEVVTHPGFYSPPAEDELRSNMLERFLKSKNRRIEYDALIDHSVKKTIADLNIKLINFDDI